MIAGLQCHHLGAAEGPITGGPQCHHLSVRSPDRQRGPDTGDIAVRSQDHSADRRIGIGGPFHRLRLIKGQLHRGRHLCRDVGHPRRCGEALAA